MLPMLASCDSRPCSKLGLAASAGSTCSTTTGFIKQMHIW
jgi:hypothetical protein